MILRVTAALGFGLVGGVLLLFAAGDYLASQEGSAAILDRADWVVETPTVGQEATATFSIQNHSSRVLRVVGLQEC